MRAQFMLPKLLQWINANVAIEGQQYDECVHCANALCVSWPNKNSIPALIKAIDLQQQLLLSIKLSSYSIGFAESLVFIRIFCLSITSLSQIHEWDVFFFVVVLQIDYYFNQCNYLIIWAATLSLYIKTYYRYTKYDTVSSFLKQNTRKRFALNFIFFSFAVASAITINKCLEFHRQWTETRRNENGFDEEKTII